MASFGHVAVGMLTGRLHGGGSQRGARGPEPGGGRRRACSWPTMVMFAGLALLPDADVLLVALGACDDGACGHRGASHSLSFAMAVGLLAGVLARRWGWPALRTAGAAAIAVASHAVLDLLGEGGRGLPLFWPFSDERFTSPIRIFPDAPRGLALLSRPGVINVAIEFAVFLPLMLYALWPRIAGWLAAREGSIPKLPDLTFVEGASAPAPAAAESDEGDPPLRSAG
jgi:inner membrane protein